MLKCSKPANLSLANSKINTTGQFQSHFFGNFSKMGRSVTPALCQAPCVSEYSVNKSTSVHPQSKSHQLLFFLHLLSAVEKKTKIVLLGEKRGKKTQAKQHTSGKERDINGYFKKKNFLFNRHFDNLIKKGHDDDDDAIKN